MRIQDISRIGAVQAYQKSATPAKDTDKVKARGDQVEISTEAKEQFQLAKGSLDSRQQRIQSLKEQITSGNYQVDSRKVAEKILDSWNKE